ncbi:MAG TPA: hypothetical protein VF281_00370 [Candidatus Saccharimonadales bacterium]
MYQNNLSPNLDQPSRVDATEFIDDGHTDTRIDLHASKLAQVAQVAAAREAIIEATQAERAPTQAEIYMQEIFQSTMGVRENHSIYHRDYIDLENDERPEQDMFKDAA